MPESIFRVVVFPAPFGPKNPISSPSSILKDIPFSASLYNFSLQNRLLREP